MILCICSGCMRVCTHTAYRIKYIKAHRIMGNSYLKKLVCNTIKHHIIWHTTCKHKLAMNNLQISYLCHLNRCRSRPRRYLLSIDLHVRQVSQICSIFEHFCPPAACLPLQRRSQICMYQ